MSDVITAVCPICARPMRRRRSDCPAPSWVAAGRKFTLHSITSAEAAALDQFALVLRLARQRTGQTRRQLAATTGLSVSYLKDLEAGIRRPRFGTLQSLAWGLRPAPARQKGDGSTLLPGDSHFRDAWMADAPAVAHETLSALLDAVGCALAPPRGGSQPVPASD